MPELPGAGGAAPPPDVHLGNGEGPPADDAAAAAKARRDQVQADYDGAMASAQATREHAHSLNVSADAIEEQAATDKAAALAAEDKLEKEA
jgi:hypothetical protein